MFFLEFISENHGLCRDFHCGLHKTSKQYRSDRLQVTKNIEAAAINATNGGDTRHSLCL